MSASATGMTAMKLYHLLGDEGSLPQYSQKHSKIQHCTPEPVTRVEPSRLHEVPPKQDHGEAEKNLIKADLSEL